jgi:hypothetical protein
MASPKDEENQSCGKDIEVKKNTSNRIQQMENGANSQWPGGSFVLSRAEVEVTIHSSLTYP